MELFGEYARAFLCGGLLCLIGQVLIDRTKLTPARILVAYVVAGVVLGGLGIYQYIADFGGAGATVPLTGFGYLLAKGTAKAVAEQGVLGALTGGVTAAAGASPPPCSSACWRRSFSRRSLSREGRSMQGQKLPPRGGNFSLLRTAPPP